MSHASATGEAFTPGSIPDRPDVPQGAPRLIVDQAGLEDAIAQIRDARICCYDTEFIGESYYHPKLCLVQLSTNREVFVVDALARVELTPLWELLADPSVEKVVHAGEQDLEPVLRILGRAPANFLDTQAVAGMAGLPYPLSLRRLVETVLGVRLSKALTFTSWDQRPLSPAHLSYAADDVRYGLAIHGELLRRLGELDRISWAREECDRLCAVELFRADFAGTAQKIRGSAKMSRVESAILYELVVLRDSIAREHDLPPRSVLRDEVLTELCRRSPRTTEKLGLIHGLPRPIAADYGGKIVEAVEHGRTKREPPWPSIKTIEETPAEQFRVDSLWALTQTMCRAMSVDPAMVCSRATFADALREAERGAGPNATELRGWRGRLIRPILGSFMGGDKELTFKWNDDQLSVAPAP